MNKHEEAFRAWLEEHRKDAGSGAVVDIQFTRSNEGSDPETFFEELNEYLRQAEAGESRAIPDALLA